MKGGACARKVAAGVIGVAYLMENDVLRTPAPPPLPRAAVMPMHAM